MYHSIFKSSLKIKVKSCKCKKELEQVSFHDKGKSQMRQVWLNKLNRSSGKHAICWHEPKQWIHHRLGGMSTSTIPAVLSMWSCDTREQQMGDWTGQWSNKQYGQCLSNAQHKLAISEKTNVALGTVHTLLIPPTEDWWKQLSPRGDLADDLKWMTRCMVGEDKRGEGAQTVTGHPRDGRAGGVRLPLQPPSVPLPSPQEGMGRKQAP